MKLNISELTNLISSAEQGFTVYKKVFATLADNYLCRYDQGIEKELRSRGKSHIFFPIINSKVRKLSSILQETFLFHDKVANITELNQASTTESNDDINGTNSNTENSLSRAEVLTNYVNIELTNKRFFSSMSKIIYESIIFGTAISKVYWSKNGLEIEHININDIQFDPDAQSYDDCRYIVHNIQFSYESFASAVNDGIFNAKSDAVIALLEVYKANKFTKQNLKDIYYYDVDNATWRVSTVYNDTLPLRDSVILKDGNPFIVGYLMPQVKSFAETGFVAIYGDSPISALLPLQHELNIMRNQYIDAIAETLSPKVITAIGAGVDPADLKRGAGSVIRVNNINSIQTLPPPNISATREGIEQIKYDIDDVIGGLQISDSNINGTNANVHSTATGVSILASESSSRIQALVRCFGETFFEPLLLRVSYLVYKYSKEYDVKLTRRYINVVTDKDGVVVDEFISEYNNTNNNATYNFIDGYNTEAVVNTEVTTKLLFDFNVNLYGSVNGENKTMQFDKLESLYTMFVNNGEQEKASRIADELVRLVTIKS